MQPQKVNLNGEIAAKTVPGKVVPPQIGIGPEKEQAAPS